MLKFSYYAWSTILEYNIENIKIVDHWSWRLEETLHMCERIISTDAGWMSYHWL